MKGKINLNHRFIVAKRSNGIQTKPSANNTFLHTACLATTTTKKAGNKLQPWLIISNYMCESDCLHNTEATLEKSALTNFVGCNRNWSVGEKTGGGSESFCLCVQMNIRSSQKLCIVLKRQVWCFFFPPLLSGCWRRGRDLTHLNH